MTFWKDGVSAVQSRVAEVRRRQVQGAREGIQLALVNILNVSNSQVPHEEGDLERDGRAALEPGEALRGGIGYGSNVDTKDYAVVQHEDMTLRHDAGRNAKFLENAFNSQRDQSREIIRTAISRKLET